MVQKVTVELYGEKELLAQLRQLPVKVFKKALRAGLTKAGTRLVKQAKNYADKSKETGLLKKSLWSRVWTGRDGMTMGVVVGPRKGFGQCVYLRTKGKKAGSYRAFSRKKMMTGAAAGMKAQYRDPVRYAHLVERGTKYSGAKPFLRPALQVNSNMVLGMLRAEIKKAIDAQ